MRIKKNLKIISMSTAAAIAVTALPGLAAQESERKPTRAHAQRIGGLGDIERGNRLIGMRVLGSDRQEIGELNNLIVDLESGRILYAVIDPAGVGGTDVAVAPQTLTRAQGDTIYSTLTRQQLRDAPEFKKDLDSPQELGKASYVNQVYQHFDQNPWWKGSRTTAEEGTFNNTHRLRHVVGMNVKNVSDQPMGEVANVMVDLHAGRVPFVILKPDKDLDLGDKYFALPPDALTLAADGKSLTSDISREKLNSAPSFTRDEYSRLSDRTFASRVYQHYGKHAYFESGTERLQPTGRDQEREFEQDRSKQD